MIKTYGLTHVALAVRDVARAARFYQDVFGAVDGGAGGRRAPLVAVRLSRAEAMSVSQVSTMSLRHPGAIGPAVRVAVRHLITAALVVGTPSTGAAQVVEGTARDSGWVVASIAHADLWYHGLAILGVPGSGPLSPYREDYVASIAAEKRRRGVYPTPLDEHAESLAGEFDRLRDQLATLDFAPLYFLHTDREQTFAALRAVADGRDEWDQDDPARSGGMILAESLRSSRARRALRRFLDAMEAEWRLFYERYWHEQVANRQAQIQQIQTAWERTFAPALQPFLRSRGLGNGVLVLAPAIGFEGRVVHHDLDAPVFAAVSLLEAPGQAHYSTLLLIRELCFLSMNRTERALSGSGEERERALRNLAVRCGEILIEHYAPAALAAYRQLFAFPLERDDPSPGVLAELYPANADALAILKAELLEPDAR